MLAAAVPHVPAKTKGVGEPLSQPHLHIYICIYICICICICIYICICICICIWWKAGAVGITRRGSSTRLRKEGVLRRLARTW